MKKNHYLKLALDLIMIVVLVLMYNKNAISMSFHEIGGLILLGLFIIHLILNSKWVMNATTQVLKKTTPGKIRLCYLIDLLLLITFLLIGISGAMISKVVFSFGGTSIFRTIHYFCSALSLILMGIHLGLHYTYIKSLLGILIKLPATFSRVLPIILATVLLLFGGYSISTTSFTQ